MKTFTIGYDITPTSCKEQTFRREIHGYHSVENLKANSMQDLNDMIRFFKIPDGETMVVATISEYDGEKRSYFDHDEFIVMIHNGEVVGCEEE